MKAVLITGSSGFLAQHLFGALPKQTSVIQSSTTQNNLLHRDFGKDILPFSLDYIFHCAAFTKAGDFSLKHPGQQWEVNQDLNTAITKYWRHNQPQAKLITFGSSCGYSPGIDYKTEENYLSGSVDQYYYGYGNVKRAHLFAIESYAREFGLKYMYFIPSVFYGPNFKLDDAHFIYDLIRKIYKGKTENAEVKLIGNGFQKRGLIFVKDAVNIILDKLSEENQLINLTSKEDLTIREYAQIICNVLDYDFQKIIFNYKDYSGVDNKRLDDSKIRHYTLTTFEEGIKQTIDNYVERINKEY